MTGKVLSSLIHEIALKLGHGASSDEEADLNDLSYEDALLDVELRSFMRAEYGKAQPPQSAFPRIMRAIGLYRQEQSRTAEIGPANMPGRILSSLGEALVTAYRFGTRADAGRMISGGLITGLVVLTLWPGMAHSLNNGGLFGRNEDLLSRLDFSTLESTTGAPVVVSPSNSYAPPAATFAQPTPAHSGTSAAPQSQPESPGRLYDDPILLTAHRTGEDVSELEDRSGTTAYNDGNTGGNKSNPGQSEPNHNRPMAGQD